MYGDNGYARVLPETDGVYSFIMPDENITIQVDLKEVEAPDTNALEYVISIADNYIANGDLDGVVTEAKEAFYTAYNTAKEVLAKAQLTPSPSQASQTEVNQAACDLLATFQYLELKTDKKMLNMLIDLADSILENADDYIPNSIARLQAVVDAAKVVSANDSASNQEVNQMVIKLIDEIDKARLRPDKSALAGLIIQMRGLDSKLYTSESFASLMASVEQGETILSDDNAEAEEVNNAVKAIQANYANLKKLSTNSENSSNSDTGCSSNPSGNGSNSATCGKQTVGSENSPKTGDSMPLFVMILVILSVGSVFVTKKR